MDEYHRLVPEVLERLQSVVGENRIAVVPAYRSKESFGDMDVVVELTQGSAYELRQALARAFDIDFIASDGGTANQLDVGPDAEVAVRTAAQLAASGKTYSFVFRELQIDILPATSETFEPSLNYFAYNDCGNLLGRIAHAFGLKFGHLGLLYPFKSGDYQFAELEVERDWTKILPAFGWDYARWAQGFETLEDMFRFVADAPFFNPDVYLMHNRSHRARTRDRKRPSYQRFLVWLEQQPAGSLAQYDYSAPKEARLELLFERLAGSGFREKYDVAARDFEAWKQARARFNGKRVGKWSGLQGKALAGLMTRVRAEMGETSEQVQAFVLAHGDEELRALVLECQPRCGNEAGA
jgi:hypothetical protein